MYILITGNPVDGFHYEGPFDIHQEAVEAGEDVGADWWVATLDGNPESRVIRAAAALWEIDNGLADEKMRHFYRDDAEVLRVLLDGIDGIAPLQNPVAKDEPEPTYRVRRMSKSDGSISTVACGLTNTAAGIVLNTYTNQETDRAKRHGDQVQFGFAVERENGSS